MTSQAGRKFSQGSQQLRCAHNIYSTEDRAGRWFLMACLPPDSWVVASVCTLAVSGASLSLHLQNLPGSDLPGYLEVHTGAFGWRHYLLSVY